MGNAIRYANLTMSEVIRYTLVGEGSSDRVLLHPINWMLRCHLAGHGFIPEGKWADLSTLPHPPRGIGEKCRFALQLYPCELLFIHRDSDNNRRDNRVQEINEALASIELRTPPIVCVVPIRMTEAWLLFSEGAIRQASGNPSGREPLRIPPFRRVETQANPKQILHDALRVASELSGRRYNKFRPESAVHRLAELITDYSPLRQLSAFSAVELEVQEVLRAAFR